MAVCRLVLSPVNGGSRRRMKPGMEDVHDEAIGMEENKCAEQAYRNNGEKRGNEEWCTHSTLDPEDDLSGAHKSFSI